MDTRSTLRTFTGTLVVSLLVCGPVRADVFAFDPSAGGAGYGSFDELLAGYRSFMGVGNAVIDLNGLSQGETLADQYQGEYGVVFLNTTSVKHSNLTGIHSEGNNVAEDITGYDGSYMPDGDSVYVKFNNDLLNSPFTITFNEPVDRVGSFLGMGVQGSVHSLTVSAYDDEDQLLGEFTFDSWLWETKTGKQNYETFFGLESDTPVISRVEIRNDATKNFSNALIFDNLEFHQSGSPIVVPEAGTSVLLIAGIFQIFSGLGFGGTRPGRVRRH